MQKNNRSRYVLLFISVFGLIILLSIASRQTTAQDTTPTPIPTLERTPGPSPTDLPRTPLPTATNTPTPLPDPQLESLLTNRVPITIDNVVNLRPFHRWRAHYDNVTSLAFSPDHNYLVSTGRGELDFNAMNLWDIYSGTINRIGEAFADASGSQTIPHAQFSHDGSRLGTHTALWETDTYQLYRSLPQAYAITSFPLGNDEVWVGGANGAVVHWFLDHPLSMQGVDKIDSSIIQVLVSTRDIPNPPVFLLSTDGTLHIHRSVLNVNGSTLTRVPQAMIQNTTQSLIGTSNLIAEKPDTDTVAFAGSYNNVIVYDTVMNAAMQNHSVEHPVICVDYSPDGKMLMIGVQDDVGTLYFLPEVIFDIYSSAVTTIPTGLTLTSCSFNADGTLVAAGGASGEAMLWGVE